MKKNSKRQRLHAADSSDEDGGGATTGFPSASLHRSSSAYLLRLR